MKQSAALRLVSVRFGVLASLLVAALSAAARADSVLQTSAGEMQITAVARGLDEPWAIAHLPDGQFLVTERDRGRLILFAADGAKIGTIKGLPEISHGGQGGLLDVMIPRDFAADPAVYLTYSTRMVGGRGTALARGRLDAAAMRLHDVTVLFAAPSRLSGAKHFGARVIEAQDSTLYLALGERGTGPDGLQAQDPALPEGKVIHLNRDGSPATTLDGALAGVFTLGHRNPQGLIQTAAGEVILVEHGPQGGDEVNVLAKGGNYGWPLVTKGEEYGGGVIGTAQMDGMIEPRHHWTPSIAPSGLMEYTGNLIPQWRGNLLTGSLKFDHIARLDLARGYAEERLSAPETGRVRDVAQAPDGSIWFLSVTDGAVYRLAPVEK
ncbi:MAG: PQQ-dependent sugar dehydrogenase [Cypionkella sp.]|nr:PQQ-dependent sugar dehydrogenase [Cypionkella sp.]